MIGHATVNDTFAEDERFERALRPSKTERVIDDVTLVLVLVAMMAAMVAMAAVVSGLLDDAFADATPILRGALLGVSAAMVVTVIAKTARRVRVCIRFRRPWRIPGELATALMCCIAGAMALPLALGWL